jgi:hypothetical protein
MEPRKPNEAEIIDLLDFIVPNKYANPTPEDYGEESDAIDSSAYIAVFDDYITDGPGYAGKVMVVIWSGSPSFTETYIWERDVLPGEEHTPLGQIDWHDGKHEPKLEKITIEQ